MKNRLLRARPDTLISGGVVVASAALYRVASDYPPQAAQYPKVLLALMFVLGVFVLAQSLWLARKQEKKSGEGPFFEPPTLWSLWVYGACIFFAALIEPFGFFVPAMLFFILVMRYFGERRWLRLLLFPVCFNFFVYVVFVSFLKVPLPMFPYF